MNEKLYITIKSTEKDSVNWGAENIIERKNRLRSSLDDSEFIIKWSAGVNTPPSVEAIPSESKSNILTHAQARELMSTPEWSEEPPE